MTLDLTDEEKRALVLLQHAIDYDPTHMPLASTVNLTEINPSPCGQPED